MNKTDQIADAFYHHFCHYGFKKTSVDEVANELGISKKTIYQHFNSKEEIFQYVVERLAQSRLKEFRRNLEGIQSNCDKFRKLVDMLFEHRREVLISKGKIRDRHEQEVILAAFKNAFYDLEKGILINGKEAGEFEIDDVDRTTRYIQGIIATGIEEIEEDHDLRPESEIKEAICKLLK